MAERGISLEIDEGALVYLAERGYDPAYGARPLKRVIQKLLIDQVARKILSGDFTDGDVIQISFAVDGLVIEKPVVN